MKFSFKASYELEEKLAKTGKLNALTDVEGILVGNYTDLKAVSGVTVVVCPQGAVAGAEVRGSAPATRETDLLAPHNLIEKAQAVVLSGGSVFGLSAADGATHARVARVLDTGPPVEDGDRTCSSGRRP